ncbi:MAG TPA: hypothetical protein VKQ06_05635 [Gammaproteobacteria bacterium]|nr:hypothetical protein [Gammaproteobacteria bacterium]
MSNEKATRRGFFLKAGAVVSVPVAFMGAAQAEESPALAARLARLEDERTLRRIGAELIAAVNVGDRAALEPLDTQLREIGVTQFDSSAHIEVRDDRCSAHVRIDCVAAFDKPIEAPGSSLLDMARSQGEGFVRTRRRMALELHCERTPAGWQLLRARLASRS